MRMVNIMRIIGVLCAAAVFTGDRVLKNLANHHRLHGHFIGNIHFAWLHNYGAGGGLLQHQLWLLIPLGLIAIFVIVRLAFSVHSASPIFWIGWGLFLGGAADNTLDRVWHGYVTDMLQYPGNRFVFNGADAAIRYGALLILLHFVIDTVIETVQRRQQKKSESTDRL